MPKLTSIALALALSIAAGSGSAFAQGCVDKAAEGTAPNRDAALRQAYAGVLQATDPQLLKAWTAGDQRIGEAPGYTVRKLTSNCTAGGAGQICRIEVNICKN
jgi:hypothetical protein